MRVNSFSCGHSFFYWPKYQKEYGNIQYGSYKGSELFIKKGKYNSLKDEILSNIDNEINDIKKWNENVVLKANEFINTKRVKSMYVDNYDMVRARSKITIEHIQAIILYTDFSLLSYSFTKAFRKESETEELNSIKNRNAKYYWFSKLLIEVIHSQFSGRACLFTV